MLPILSVAQTLPHFAYLIPVVVFFGIGHQTGVIATIIFAVPPMVRLTLLGLQKVSPEIVEAGKMSGCTSFQLLFRVQLPSARNELLLGVNQVIMQCLAMVVIAAFIGASGLGYRLLHKLQSLKLGQSLEIGVAIVLLAVVLDGLSTSLGREEERLLRQPAFPQALPVSHSHGGPGGSRLGAVAVLSHAPQGAARPHHHLRQDLGRPGGLDRPQLVRPASKPFATS